MKFCRWIAAMSLWLVGSAQAFDTQIFHADAPVFSGHMQTCFTHAMVGMDSVINARLGVPPEHVVALTANTVVENAGEEGIEAGFDEPVLTLMLNAYLWQGSPHSYAIQVFYDCAASAPMVAGEVPEQEPAPMLGQSDGPGSFRHN